MSDELEAALELAVVEMLGANASRVMRAFELFERARPRDAPHFYLSLLGTSASRRCPP